MIPLEEIYKKRFDGRDKEKKQDLWKVLAVVFFQRFIKKTDTVMDIGAGYCEFINVIEARKKIAVDMNPDMKLHCENGIIPLLCSVYDIPQKYNGSVDVIFISNVLEHLNSKEEVLTFLQRCHTLLSLGGNILIVQPNISLVKERYWDFFDHKVPLNDRTVLEGLALAHFKPKFTIKRFLPYSTRYSKVPLQSVLLRLYLLIPYQIRPFAGQSFFLATKSG